MKNLIENFEWGDTPQEYVNLYTQENLIEKIYLKYYDIKKNDVILDLGANCGSFTCSILDQNPKKVYSVEPDYMSVNCLNKNIEKYKKNKDQVIVINKFIGNVDYDRTIRFKSLIKKYKIDHIDFMKIDCEGGEFSIFTKENYNFISNRVKNIAGEYHISSHSNSLQNFFYFRDKYLDKSIFKTIKVFDRWGNDLSVVMYDNGKMYEFERFYNTVNPNMGQLIIYAGKD